MKNSILTILRGIGQVMFQCNALSGTIMLAGIAAGSLSAAAMALAGNIVSTITARLCRYPANEIREGLYGFNGTLTGIAVGVFFVPGWTAAALLVAGAAISTLLARLFMLWRKPGYTAPFIIATWLLLAAALWFPQTRLPAMETASATSAQWFRAMSLHFGQVMFEVRSFATGIMFLIGIAVNDRRAAAYALLGTVLPLAAIFLTGDYDVFNAGLYGYNGVLCAIALAGPARADLLKAVTAVVLSTVLQYIGIRHGLPTLTAPFVVATWIVAALSRHPEHDNQPQHGAQLP